MLQAYIDYVLGVKNQCYCAPLLVANSAYIRL